MSEVKRPGRAEFKRVSRGGDVVQMQFGATGNEPLHCPWIELAKEFRVPFERFEKLPVANQSDLDGFDVAGSFVPRRQRGQQFEVVDHGKGRRECSNEVLLAESVDAILHADAGISLAQGGRGNADVTNTTMSSGGGETDHVQQSATTDRDNAGMTI